MTGVLLRTDQDTDNTERQPCEVTARKQHLSATERSLKEIKPDDTLVKK